MAKVQDCRLLRDRRHCQINAGKAPQGLAVIQRILHRTVGQPIPLLQKVDPQHPLQTDRWPTALALRIERSQTFYQPRPRYNLLHLSQKLVASCLLLLAGVFRLRKAPLKLHRPVPRPHLPADSTPYRPAARYFFGVSLAFRFWTGSGRSNKLTFAGTGRGTGFSGPNKELTVSGKE